jgi:hypothetical protein
MDNQFGHCVSKTPHWAARRIIATVQRIRRMDGYAKHGDASCWLGTALHDIEDAAHVVLHNAPDFQQVPLNYVPRITRVTYYRAMGGVWCYTAWEDGDQFDHSECITEVRNMVQMLGALRERFPEATLDRVADL